MFRAPAAALMLALAGPALAESVTRAEFDDPTTRYSHGVLGDAVEYGALVMETDGGRRLRLVLPEHRVFEDVAPRLADVDGDGEAEVIVVETDTSLGARLSVYDPSGLIAANEFIGRRFRWLAPVGVGAADLDGDGAVELAYVDRPHLAKTLRIFRYREGALEDLAALPGVTNHRIGDRDIVGGIRDCGAGPEMVVADANWRRVLAVRFDGSGFERRDIGPVEGPGSFAAALDCG